MPTNPPVLSPAAKSKVAAAVAVAVAGITAWQAATRDGFTWIDVIPVVAAVAGAASVDLVPNTPRQPVAKAVVHGALSAVAAVAAAVAAFAAHDPHGMTALKLATVAAGAFAVWWVPESADDVKVIEGEVADGAPVAQVLQTVAGDVSALMGPDLPAPAPAAAPPVTPRQVDKLPSSAWSLHPVAAGTSTNPTPAPASTPTPIADAVAGPPTQPMPAVTPDTTAPAPTPAPAA